MEGDYGKRLRCFLSKIFACGHLVLVAASLQLTPNFVGGVAHLYSIPFFN